MTVPQPSEEPYSTGDHVVIYVGPDDPEESFHGVEAIVTERFEDSLGENTERELDSYLYQIKAVESDEIMSVDFRHFDLVPADEFKESESNHLDSTGT